jgi:hypothetical protein
VNLTVSNVAKRLRGVDYQMPRDFLLFVTALWREWKALLIGGSIIALEALWMFSGKPPIPQAINWLSGTDASQLPSI